MILEFARPLKKGPRLKLSLHHLKVSLFASILLFISQPSQAAPITIYGPQSFSAGMGKAKEYTASVAGPGANKDGVITIINGDGTDLIPEICSGSLPQRAFCEIENKRLEIKAKLERPETPEIYWNGVLVVSSSSLPQYRGKLQIAVKVQAQNNLKVRLQGNPNSSLSIEIKSESGVVNQLPIARMSATPNGGIAPELISFSGLMSSDPDNDPLVDYSWDFNDGSFASGALVTHNFVAAGTYNVKLTVTDSRGGKGSVTQAVVIRANQLPLASFVATPDTGLGELKVQFDASGSSDSDGSIVEYIWNFGDGNGGTGKLASHVYSAPGTYAVQLTVKDNKSGVKSVTKNVDVADRVAPVLTLTIPQEGQVIAAKEFSFAGSANERLSGLSISLNGSSPVAVALNSDQKSFAQVFETIMPGPQTLTVKALDLAGNESTKTIHFSSDFNRPPLADLKLKSPASGEAPFVAWFDASSSSDPDANTLKFSWDFGDGESAADSLAILTHEYKVAGSYTVTLTVDDGHGGTSQKSITVEAVPAPVPEEPTPPVLGGGDDPNAPPTEVASFEDRVSFLYSGNNPIQKDTAPGIFDPEFVSTVSGVVLDQDGQPLGGVEVRVANTPEFGWTRTRADGKFDFAFNLKSIVSLQFSRDGYAPVQREIIPSGQNTYTLADFRMVRFDEKVTLMVMGAPTAQVAQGTPSNDASGERTATVLISSDTTAKIRLKNGQLVDAPSLSIRATEFTVGEHGPERMPANLPPRSAYTYAVELSADEARSLGAEKVEFSKPISFYVDNFLNVPVGAAVPLGYFNADRNSWDAMNDGVVMQILDIRDQKAVVSVTQGGGEATTEDLNYFGFDDSELKKLAATYPVGKSLWRVRINHFSTLDANFGSGSAVVRQDDPIGDDLKGSTAPCGVCPGSIIEPIRQILGEKLALPGVSQSLYYSTEKVAGRLAANQIYIPVTNAVPMPDLKQVVLTVEIAGQRYERIFPPILNQTWNYVWDGLDGYGRIMAGTQKAIITLSYQFDSTYWVVWYDKSYPITFDTYNPGTTITNIPTRNQINFDRQFELYVKPANDVAAAQARMEMGRWTFSEHHYFDKSSKRLNLGNGQTIAINNQGGSVRTLSGSGSSGYSSDEGIPAKGVSLGSPTNFYYDPTEDSIYVPEPTNNRIRKIDRNGNIRTIAGTGTPGFNGDGGRALDARLNAPNDITKGPDGTIYFSDAGNNRIRKITPSGIIQTVAGNGDSSYTGDGGPAVNATFSNIRAITFGTDHSIYITDGTNNVIRRISPDGIIRTFAGNGLFGFSGDGGPATKASFASPESIAFDNNGAMYVADAGNRRVRKILPDGTIQTVAGNGGAGYSGDGAAAINASFSFVSRVFALDSGEFFIADTENNRIRYVDTKGNIQTIVGTGRYHSGPDGQTALLTDIKMPRSLAVKPDGTILFVEDEAFRIREYSNIYIAQDSDGNFMIPSRDAQDIYIFSPFGIHLKTLFSMTGATKWQYQYSNQGLLTGIQDADGNLTQINRDGSGNPVAIITPDAQSFPVQIDGVGNLAQVTYPTGESYQMRYRTGGLLTDFIKPNGVGTHYEFDGIGRLRSATDPAGGIQSYTEIQNGSYRTTREGPSTSFQSFQNPHGATDSYVTRQDGHKTRYLAFPNRETVHHPEGHFSDDIARTEQRLGGMATIPFFHFFRTTLAQTTTSQVATERNYEYINSLFDFRFRDFTNNNDYGGITTTYQSNTRTWNRTTLLGRVSTIQTDAQTRPIFVQTGNDIPTEMQYDSRGRLTKAARGDRVTEMQYDQFGFVTSIKNPLGYTTNMHNNASGRTLASVNARGETTGFSYDNNGNLSTITNALGILHGLTYSLVDLLSVYKAPDAPGAGRETKFIYDFDKRLKQKLIAGGQTLNYLYEPATGQLANIVGSDGSSLSISYFPQKTLVQSLSSESASIAYTYEGNYPLTKTYSVQGKSYQVAQTFTAKGLLNNSQTVGGLTVNFSYDGDELITQAGNMQITRDTLTGRILSMQSGVVLTTRSYNGFGEVSREETTVNGSPFLTLDYLYDNLGRVKRRTYNGTTAYDFEYDQAGRLTRSSVNGFSVESYTYDANGNRTKVDFAGTVINATFDAQDRLKTYDYLTAEYTPDGTLSAKKRTDGRVTLLEYDLFGQTKRIQESDGTEFRYLRDGEGHRVAKYKNSVLQSLYAYDFSGRLIGEMNPDGSPKSVFVYASQGHSPDLMIKDGVTYRFIKNQVGSVLFVVNTDDGSVAQSRFYGEFGYLLNDSNPGFQPFGFAGGLHDPDTGLVRFGARDYDNELQRWTAKDPILFAGGDTNLNTYVSNDPTNFVDPNGKCPLCAAVVVGAVVGGVANVTGSYLAGTLTRSNAAATFGLGALAGGAAVLTSGTAALATATSLTGLLTAELGSGFVGTLTGLGIDLGLTALLSPPSPYPQALTPKLDCPPKE